MGSYMSCHSSVATGGKVVLPDGTFHEFDRPIVVAELMLEHPQHFVVEFRSPPGVTKLAPLPADHKLDTDEVYLMVPKARGKGNAVSADEARRIISAARSMVRSRNLPLVGTCMIGFGDKGREEAVGDGLMEREEEVGKVEWSTEGFGETAEFLSRQYSNKGWKPSLRTIEERGMERKVPHWLF